MLKEARQYSIGAIQDEVRALVTKGLVGKQNQIYCLARYFEDMEWRQIEQILNSHEYLLRDYVYDLIGRESWNND
ncbi:MAG: DUF4327 family protein [Cyanobacteria bacterium P01_D01_bin.105]